MTGNRSDADDDVSELKGDIEKVVGDNVANNGVEASNAMRLAIDDEVLRDVVHNKLVQLKSGDLFMEFGLDERQIHNLLPPDGSEHGEVTESFDRLLGAIAAALVEMEYDDGGSVESDSLSESNKKRKKKKKGSKSRRKAMKEALLLHRGKIEHEIRLFGASGTRKSNIVADSTGRDEGKGNALEGDENRTAMDERAESPSYEHRLIGSDEEERNHREIRSFHDDASSSKRSKKKSRKKRKEKKEGKRGKKKEKKKSKRSKHREKVIMSDESEVDDGLDNGSSHAAVENEPEEGQTSIERVETAEYLAAKKQFERERDEILNRVPAEVRSRFRQVGFGLWGKGNPLPVLELGPYDVSPGPVRDQWMGMLENCERSGRPLTRLVFWYGTNDWDQAYSFLPRSKIFTYEEGVKLGYHELPQKLTRKMRAGQALSKNEQHHVTGLADIKEEADRKPEDRLAWAPDFKEHYELLLFADNGAETLEEEPIVEEGDHASAKVKGRKKTRKKKSQGTSDDEIVTKPPKKRLKKKAKNDDSREDATQVDRFLSDEDIPTDAEKDEDFHVDGSSEDELEDEFELTGKKRKRKGKNGDKMDEKAKPDRRMKKKKADMTEEEKEAHHQEQLKRRREKGAAVREHKRREKAKKEGMACEPLKPKAISLKKQHEEQQRLFEVCEEEFLPLINELRESIDAEDVDTARQCLEGIREKVDIITPHFVVEYKLGILVKQTRRKFEDDFPDVRTLCHKLTDEMRTVYMDKQRSIPKDFHPKKAKAMNAQPDVSESTPAEPSFSGDTLKKEPPKLATDANSDNHSAKPISDDRKKDRSEALEESILPEKEEIQSTAKTSVDQVKSAFDVSVPKKVLRAEKTVEPPVQLPQASKPARKTFSLKGMFDRPKTSSNSKERGAKASVPSTAQQCLIKQLPTWITAPAPDEDSLPQDDDRSIALEYLKEAACHFPSEKVNILSISVALESAVFEWCQLNRRDFLQKSSKKWPDDYWDKIHDVVAAIAGKRGTGTIVRRIMNGVYEKPVDVIGLSKQELNASFEGFDMT